MVKPPWKYQSDSDEPDGGSVPEADSPQDEAPTEEEDLTETPPPADAPWVFKAKDPIGPDRDDTVLIEYIATGKRARVGQAIADAQVSRGRAKRL